MNPPSSALTFYCRVDFGHKGCFPGAWFSDYKVGTGAGSGEVPEHRLQFLVPPEEELRGAVAGVEVGDDLQQGLVLAPRHLLPHGAVHQLQHVLVEVVHELREVLLVGVRRQTVPADPVYLKLSKRIVYLKVLLLAIMQWWNGHIIIIYRCVVALIILSWYY